MEYIRKYKASENYKQDTKYCIYGLDADLIMLSLITHEPNIVVLRDVCPLFIFLARNVRKKRKNEGHLSENDI
jgi:5'-3' exonuclease